MSGGARGAAAVPASRGPLAGVTVLELAQIMAGPSCKTEGAIRLG
ncbi:MAG: hypothetical protein ABI809_05665 [Caldimonas sp.]